MHEVAHVRVLSTKRGANEREEDQKDDDAGSDQGAAVLSEAVERPRVHRLSSFAETG